MKFAIVALAAAIATVNKDATPLFEEFAEYDEPEFSPQDLEELTETDANALPKLEDLEELQTEIYLVNNHKIMNLVGQNEQNEIIQIILQSSAFL